MLKRSLMGLLALVLAIGLFVANPLKAEAASSFKSSDALIGVLKKMEGFSKKPYWDVSQWTVGYGTRCPDDKLAEYKENGISKSAAQALLEEDLKSREKKINKFIDKYELKLKQHQFDALVSFTYNCGTGWLSETDGFFNNAVRSGDLSNDFLYGICLWSSAGGEYILINRRMCEANMYINGVYKASNSGDEDLFPDNFRWVFLDGNGGEVRYKMHAFDAKKPRSIQAELTKIPTYTDSKGNTVKYTMAGWFTEDGKLVEKLDESISAGEVLYAKWKDAEGNIVDIPRGKKPGTDQVVITGDEVNVRSGPGTFYKKVGKVYEGDVLTITEVYEGNGYTWGKFSKGWVSLSYAEAISADMKVRIKTQPTSASAVEGEKVTISLKASGDGLKYQWYYKSGSKFKACSGTGKASYSITMTQARAGREMYCIITDKYGNKVQSNTVTLGMKINISKQPVSDSASVGEKVKFSVSATGADLSYQWYYKDADKSAFTPSSGVGKASYSITMTEARAGREMYCVLTDKFGNSVTTKTVSMHLGATITQQPKSVQAPNGQKVTTSVSAMGDSLSYQWYYKNEGASKFKKSSIQKATYSITMSESYAGRQVYCVVTDAYGSSVKSKTVTLGMTASISTQPKNASAVEGKKVTISLKATGDGLKYQWYYKSGSKFVACSGTGKSSYSITMTQARAGREMYCVITDKYGNSVQSNTVTLGMKINISKQPVSDSAPVGDKVKFSVSATGAGLTYQWYYKDADKSEFVPCSGVGKASYSITMTEARNGRLMYCVITDKFGNSVTTKAVMMNKAVSITTQPKSAQAVKGKKVKVSVVADGEGLSYQWYYKKKGTSNFKKSSIQKATYSITMSESYTGRQVYCVITDAYGNSVKSKTVTLGMAVSISTQPKNASAYSGKKVTISLKATGDGLKYQWYYKSGSKFVACSGTGKASYSITMKKSRANRQMYCIITDKYGNTVQSNTVTLKMK